MSKNISLDEIKEFWPDKAPDINIVQKYIKKYENENKNTAPNTLSNINPEGKIYSGITSFAKV